MPQVSPTTRPLIVALLCLAWPLGGYAQEGRFQVEQFEPPPGPSLLNVPLAEVTPVGGWTLDLWMNFAHKPLVLIPVNDNIPESGVSDRLRAEVVGGFGVWRGLQVGAALPMVQGLSSDMNGLAGREQGDFEGFHLGDARLDLRGALFELMGKGKRALDISLTTTVWAPTGDEISFEGEDAWRFEPGVGVSWRGPIRLAAHLGYHVRPESKILNTVNDDMIRWRMGAEAPLPATMSVAASVFGNNSLASASGDEDSSDTPMEALVALNWGRAGLIATLGGGVGLLDGPGSPTWRGLLRVGWRSPPEPPLEPWWVAADEDLDGIPDDVDVCPFEPEDKDGVRDDDGCPDTVEALPVKEAPKPEAPAKAPEDPAQAPKAPASKPTSQPAPKHLRDAQRPPLKLEACPPEDMDGFQDADGCLDPDDDNDGILDVDDKCPRAAEIYNGVDDADGCPDMGADADGDGVDDASDTCPYEPEDIDGVRDWDGCPDAVDVKPAQKKKKKKRAPEAPKGDAPKIPIAPDTPLPPPVVAGPPLVLPLADMDGDAVEGLDDLCPRQAEDMDGFQDADGCPEPDNDGDGVLDGVDKCPNSAEIFNGLEDEDGCPDQKVAVSKESIKIGEKIYFELGKATIKAQSHELLMLIAKTLNDNPQILKVEIRGYTDSAGSARYNLRLSGSRAAAVRKFLIRKGRVSSRRLVSKGFGESGGEGDASARRVEFIITKQKEAP